MADNSGATLGFVGHATRTHGAIRAVDDDLPNFRYLRGRGEDNV